MDRIDRTLQAYVDEGRLTAELADQMRHDFHEQHVDIRQRAAELIAYAGAGLAVLGVVVIGAEVWSDFTQVVRAGVPALLSVALLIGMRFVVTSVPSLIEHPVRGRIAQVMGSAAAVLAVLAVSVAFQRPEGEYGREFEYQTSIALAVGVVVAFVASRWAPGFITTLVGGVLLFALGMSVIEAFGWSIGPVGPGVWMVTLGAGSALVLCRYFPPAWLTRALGIAVWLMGSMALILSREELYNDEIWTWVGRLSALALIVVGGWLFMQGGDWTWALGAALAAAMLVGLWFSEALNAGVALLLAGLVMIAIGAGLFAGRRAGQGTGVT